MGKEKEILKPFRERIDALDKEIVDLLKKRVDIIREVAQVKYDHDIEAILQYRVDEVRENAASDAISKGLDGDLIRSLYTTLIGYSCDLEEEIKAELRLKEQSVKSA